MPDSYKLIDYSGERCVNPGMIVIGRDLDESKLVVGRAYHNGDILPAKAKPEHGVAYVSYGGAEHAKRDFEILVRAHFDWVPSSHGRVPSNAVEGGRTNEGETLYVGRTIHEGVSCLGKIHPSHGSLYIPYNGQEICHKEYEVLTLQ